MLRRCLILLSMCCLPIQPVLASEPVGDCVPWVIAPSGRTSPTVSGGESREKETEALTEAQTVSTGDPFGPPSIAIPSLLSQPASQKYHLTLAELTSPALLGFDGLDPTSAARQGKARQARVQGSTDRRKILFVLRLLRCHSSSRSSRPCMVKGVFSCFLRSLHHISPNMKHVS